ncbi:MAG TPA: CBS domain-containing protein [Nitrospiria bacterium]|nr:CBS domain-containing protein [Nitrospiria bacterium]
MIPKIQVKRVMSKKIISLCESDTVQRSAEEMTEHGIGCVVISRGEEIFGIVTETDLVRKVLGPGLDPKEVKLESIMSFPAISIEEDALLEDAYKLMGQNQIRHLLVTSKGLPSGIISARSFMESIYP